jgi:hypothetical protein
MKHIAQAILNLGALCVGAFLCTHEWPVAGSLLIIAAVF